MVNLHQTPDSTTGNSSSSYQTNGGEGLFNPGDNTKSNPFGLGDPNDRFLRKVEKEILVPKKMRDKARFDKCTEEVAQFTECCKKSSFAMVVTCRPQNTKLKSCLTYWYQNDEFRKECENEYLKERSEYRRTGIKQKHWKKE